MNDNKEKLNVPEMTDEIRQWLDSVLRTVYPYVKYLDAKEDGGLEITTEDKALLEISRAYIYLYSTYVSK